MSASQRVQQWMTFSRAWWLFDAKWQDPFKSAVVISRYLQGVHKPIHGGQTLASDCGDHVIAINSKDIAMNADEWFYRVYFHHTGYPGGATWTKAWELHKKDPTQVLYRAVYKAIKTENPDPRRRNRMCRLHIFPDDNVPQHLLENVSDQIPQLRRKPKRIDEYSAEEIQEFPKLFDYPKDYVLK